ncbi:MAG TPA: MFS transporter [Aliidongia sp.]|nr:MFS transporter [Aliidongia sp.]
MTDAPTASLSTAPAPAAPAESAPAPVGIPWLGLVAVLLGTFLSTLNTRISVFGLADVEGAIHAGFDEGAWLTTAFTVAQMLVTPAAVWTGNMFGPRRILLASAVAFAAISVVSPFATNLPEMLTLRFAAGIASGAFVPLTLSYVLRNIPPKLAAYGVAIYALNLEFSLNISASLEGWYVDHLSWRWIFWQNVPLALGMALCLHFGGRAAPARRDRPPTDLFGLASYGIGLSLIYAALDQGNRLDWLNSGLIWGLLLAGGLLLVAFVVHDRRIPYPLLNLSLVLAHPLPSLLGLMAFLRLGILSTAYLIPLFLGTVRGFRSLEVGQTLIWVALPQAILCPMAGLLLRRVDARLVACLGFFLISVACYSVANGLTPLWGSDQFLVSQLLQAVGQSCALTGVVFFAIQHVRPESAITFGAMMNTARLMGGEIGSAFVVTFSRIHSQTASNLIGLHVQIGSESVEQRLQLYAAATQGASYPASGTARGMSVLGNAVHSMAETQGVIDAFAVMAALALIALLLMVAQRAAPIGPATYRPLFAKEEGELP